MPSDTGRMEGRLWCPQTPWMAAQTGCSLAGLCGQVVARSQGAGLSNLPQGRWGRTSLGLGLRRGFPKATGLFPRGRAAAPAGRATCSVSGPCCHRCLCPSPALPASGPSQAPPPLLQSNGEGPLPSPPSNPAPQSPGSGPTGSPRCVQTPETPRPLLLSRPVLPRRPLGGLCPNCPQAAVSRGLKPNSASRPALPWPRLRGGRSGLPPLGAGARPSCPSVRPAASWFPLCL